MYTAQQYTLGVASPIRHIASRQKLRVRSGLAEGGFLFALACFAVFCTRRSLPYCLPCFDSHCTVFLYLQELRHARHDDDDAPTPSSQLEWERLEQQEWEQRNTASSPTPQVVSYSGHDMKKAYYEAFWRARCVLLCSHLPVVPDPPGA